MIKEIAMLERRGTAILSLIGKGIDSTSAPVAAATKLLRGSVNTREPTKARRKPKSVPSSVFNLLKGMIVLPNCLPKSDAPPSPSVRTVTPTYPAGFLKRNNVRTTPKAKNMGEKAKSQVSSPTIAFLVIFEMIGVLLPLNLKSSDIT